MIEYVNIEDYDYSVNTNGEVYSYKSNKYLQPQTQSLGYQKVTLYKNKKPKQFYIHRLVMEAFVGISDLEVNHIDGDKTNNRLSNLEYCTSSENQKHAVSLGLQTFLRGEKVRTAKLTAKDIPIIRARLNLGHKQKDIASDFGISDTAVRKIKTGKTWKHI